MSTPNLTDGAQLARLSLQSTVRTQLDRLFEAQAIVMLANSRLNTFSGDEDSLAIVEELSTVTWALQVAKKLIDHIYEDLEIALHAERAS